MDSDFPFLPPEIIRNILKRLPVKSLMRFQCVCRGWRILFKTQSFIADHLDHSKHQNPCLLMKDYDLDDPSNMYCLDSEMQVWEFQNPPLLNYLKQGSWNEEKKIRLNDTGGVSSSGVTVSGVMFWWGYKTVGDDEGKNLIVSFDLAVEVFTVIPTPELHPNSCFTVYEEKLALFSWIEDPTHSVIDLWVMEEGVVRCKSLKFGTNLFSVLCGVVALSIPATACSILLSDDNRVNLVEVYSPRTGSWKEVDCDSLDGVAISSNGFNANGNGAIFWFGLNLGVEEDGEGDTDFIVSFDMAMEVFTLILAPAASIYFIYDNGFAIYDNKLAILSHTLSENFDSSLVELWVMEDDWDWDWNKRFTSRPHPGLRLLPVTIWKNEIICNATELPEIFTQSKTKVKNAEQQTAILLE
ncbi:hypothetical protein K1719_001887 [Acacia pycnantha]|nr:hypothetical protein K1719_001887 [Acacia pycnantha]